MFAPFYGTSIDLFVGKNICTYLYDLISYAGVEIFVGYDRKNMNRG